MAELGVVSGSLGIISLALQVGDCVMKLKNFINSVKDAPDEIKYTIKQIEILDLVLSSCNADEDDQHTSEAALFAMKTCKMFLEQAAGGLQIIVKELDLTIGKRRRVGSLKAVLKQSVLNTLKQRLRDAQDMLALSNQYYSQALQKRRHDMQQQWAEIQVNQLSNLEIHVKQCTEVVRSIRPYPAISASSITKARSSGACFDDTDPACPKDDCKQLATSYKKVSCSLKRQKQTLARLQFPSWLQLTSLCLEVCCQRSLYGMSLDIKVYRSVDYDAPIMKYAREGNVSAIQEMFSNGTATPHDICSDYETVLKAAAEAGQVGVCCLLIEQGAHPHARLAYFHVLRWGNPLQDPKKRLELIRILAKAVDDDDFFEFRPEASAIDGFHGDVSVLSWILNNLIGYNYQKATIEDRTRLALHLCAGTGQPRVAQLVRYLLPEPNGLSKMCHCADSYSRTLLSCATTALGAQAFRATQSSQTRKAHRQTEQPASGFKYDAQAESDCLQELLSLINELIIAGSNLHRRTYRCENNDPDLPGVTPLVDIFSSFFDLRRMCQTHQCAYTFIPEEFQYHLPIPAETGVLIPVMMWLELLYEAGIDLSEYGRREQELYREGRAVSSCWFMVWSRALRRTEFWCWGDFEKKLSIRFKYGPKPSDWQFWLIEQMDNSFAEFWDMVDHPERAMPGAWDDRFDYVEY